MDLKDYYEINSKQDNQFNEYMDLLLEWNNKMNLTAITERDDIVLKHFIDSLTINKYIKNNSKVLDVGTGAGFPGIPLKIFDNSLKITLLDSLNKRVNFLNEVIRRLNLSGIEAIHGRAEDIGRDKAFREKYDVATSRAVANLSVLLEYMLPFVKINGICICMKGNNSDREIKESTNAIKILGGKIEKIDEINLPDSDIKRTIIIVKKIRKTSNKYPRNPRNTIKKAIIEILYFTLKMFIKKLKNKVICY